MYQGRRRAERGAKFKAKLVGTVVENNRRDPRSGGVEGEVDSRCESR